jgi:hypothetical protein
VILGFAITAWIVVLLLIVYYIMVYNPNLDTFRPKDDTRTESDHPNPADKVFLSAVRAIRCLDYSQTMEANRDDISNAFNKVCTKF